MISNPLHHDFWGSMTPCWSFGSSNHSHTIKAHHMYSNTPNN
ncbi:unnamed protein product [Spirodela intermedia]|uniref:Uncharacterized protein n=1 Tax=Spirodela intermedia TaxID=51605 RepID=A0A7I8L757_SPIIN|nr:unnamed protein product [Spirodela intermedia]